MSQTLAQPRWMRPTANDEPSFAGDFRCGITGRGLIEVSGADAAGFLNSQLSTDIRAMHADDVALTSYSDAKGRLIAIMRIIATDADFLLELPADRGEAVMAQLQRYVLRADVHMQDVSGSHTAFAVVGEEAAQCVTDIIPDLPPVTGKSRLLDAGARLVPARGPRASWTVLGPVEAVGRAWGAFGALPVASGDWWELLEIEAGIPTIRASTAGRFVAQMVNLDRLDALDFRKGCYPGQEVIARTRYLGRIKRRMHLLRAAGTVVAPEAGEPVFATGGDSPCGEIVRACAHPGGGVMALAVLRSESLELVLTDGTPVSRGELPYPLDEAA